MEKRGHQINKEYEFKSNNINFLKLFLSVDLNIDQLFTFGYFLSNQKENLYNLGYYISQSNSFKSSIEIFRNKKKEYCDFFEYCVRCMYKITPKGVTVIVYIDNIFIFSNTDEHNKKTDNLIELKEWNLGFYDNLLESYDLKKISDKNTLLRIQWTSQYSTETENANAKKELYEERTLNINLSSSKTNKSRLKNILDQLR